DRGVIPYSTFRTIYGNRFVSHLIVQPRDASRGPIVKAELYRVLGRKYSFDPTDQRALGMWDFIEDEKETTAVGLGIQIFMGLVGAFTLLIAGVGVASNRSISSFSDGNRKGVRLDERPGDGVAYLRGVEFSNGTIECDIRGKDVQGQSFVGIAFHGVDSTTYEAIYFRPFNFKTPDPARHSHAVQYISHPTYTWQKLRAERPGAFEQPVSPAP